MLYALRLGSARAVSRPFALVRPSCPPQQPQTMELGILKEALDLERAKRPNMLSLLQAQGECP